MFNQHNIVLYSIIISDIIMHINILFNERNNTFTSHQLLLVFVSLYCQLTVHASENSRANELTIYSNRHGLVLPDDLVCNY